VIISILSRLEVLFETLTLLAMDFFTSERQSLSQ
jgi:hypothetical protein